MKPNELIEWTITRAAREFGLSPPTLAAKLAATHQKADEHGHYTTGQITAAIFGDLHAAQTREANERADKIALENRVARGELIQVEDAIVLTQRFCFAARQVIVTSALPDADKNCVLLNLRQLAQIDFTDLSGCPESEAGAQSAEAPGAPAAAKKAI